MTQLGKCDVCRQRKLKCDESHPICGNCHRGNRQCRYTAYMCKKGFKFVDGRQKQQNGLKSVPPGTERQMDSHSSSSSSDGRNSATSSDGNGPTKPPPFAEIDFISLRSSREAENGKGLFQTFAPVRLSKDSENEIVKRTQGVIIHRSPSNPTLRLLKRWAAVNEALVEHSDYDCAFGPWMMMVPQRIATSDSITASLECFLNGADTYVRRTPETLALTDSSNAKALRTIRASILATDPNSPQDDVLLSITLLHLTEAFVRARTGDFKYHQTGLLSLMQRASQEGRERTEVIRHLFFWTNSWDLWPAVFENRDSIWDTPTWNSVQYISIASTNPTVSRYHDEMRALHRTMTNNYVQLPRLVRLVRFARENPEDPAARVTATAAVQSLLDDDQGALIDAFYTSGIISTIPTTNTLVLPFVPDSYTFTSRLVFLGATQYWALRCAVIGLAQALADIFPVIPGCDVFDTAAMAIKDVKCAEKVAMSTQHALSTKSAIPIMMLSIHFPLQMSFGAWMRLQGREGGPLSMTAGAIYARHMKDGAMRIWNIAREKWNARQPSEEEWSMMLDILMGGPLSGLDQFA